MCSFDARNLRIDQATLMKSGSGRRQLKIDRLTPSLTIRWRRAWAGMDIARCARVKDCLGQLLLKLEVPHSSLKVRLLHPDTPIEV